MCWVTDELPELKIAKEDITTLKVVIKGYDDKLIPYFRYVDKFYYKLNRLTPSITLKITSSPFCSRYWIDKGYHSYLEPCAYKVLTYIININGDIYRNSINGKSCCLVLCIIPKGTKYYVNELGDCVSEQIIIKNIIKESL